MDLTQLANLGEFIGGVAVLVTLVYLAVQVRKANSLATADAYHKSTQAFSTWRQLVSDEGINEIWSRALVDAELSEAESLRLRVVLSELAWAGVAAVGNQQAVGTRGYEHLAPLAVARELRSESLRALWADVAEDMNAYGFHEFVAAVTDLTSRDEAIA